MVWKQTPEGTWYGEPPYTEEEERDLSRRMSNVVAVMHWRPLPPLPPQTPPAQEPEEEPRS
jgi:hypothetical protein